MPWLLLKLPFLIKTKSFFTSGKLLTVIGVIVAILFVATQISSCTSKYVDSRVKDKTEVASKTLETNQLREQVKTQLNNQKIVDKVGENKKIIHLQVKDKSKKIEDKINEQVKEGNDRFVGPLLFDTVNSL